MTAHCTIVPQGKSIAEVDVDFIDLVKGRFRETGVVLLQDFKATAPQFYQFAQRFLTVCTFDQGGSKTPPAADNYLQRILPKGHAQDLHCENGRSPFRPNLLWFYCEQPAARGGETTVADGAAIWRSLSQPVQQRFTSSKIRYRDVFNAERVPRLLHTILGNYDKYLSEGLSLHFHQDRVIKEYVTSALCPLRFSEGVAFCNSITGPYLGDVLFEDGTPLGEPLTAEIKRAHATSTEEIRLGAGDVLMLDNLRFMHGRRAFDDPNRALYSVMGLANF
jgi:alpha-ketoglutarate-dependent taurine dioxygenase